MELRHLRYFVAITEAGTMAAAAKQAFVTQSTLSHQLAQLEAELGTTLFERVGRSLKLTDAGHELLTHAKLLLQQAEETKRALSRLESMAHGSLRIGVIHSFTVGLVPQVVASYAKQWPGIRLKIVEATALEIESQVADGKLDLGIAFHPPAHHAVIGEHLFDERLLLAVPLSHPLAQQRSIRWSQLGKVSMAMLSSRFATRRLLDSYFQRANIQPNITIEIDSVEALRRIVEHAGAVTFLPELITTRSTRIRLLKVIDPQPTRSAGLIWRNSSYRNRAADQFAVAVKEHIKRLKS